MPSPEFAGKSGAGMYGDFTMRVDAEIGRILAALDKSGLAKDTLVIFTSDNCPTWYEADVERLGHASAGGCAALKSDAWEGGHRMPFNRALAGPDQSRDGERSDDLLHGSARDFRGDLWCKTAKRCGAALQPPHDPAETTKLAAKYPDKVKELLSAMQANVERGKSRSNLFPILINT